jgi:DNA polymerase III alpha subunit (gram-positive type)
MYLFFDTETTGLPKNYNAPVTDVDNFPRIIQLAWMLCDENGNEKERWCSLIKPNGWIVPNEKFWIDNGYSQEKSIAEGTEIENALSHFLHIMNDAKYLIAHNMIFDEKIVGAEFVRQGIKSEKRLVKICTKETTTNFCKLPSARGGYKWAKLSELHQKLFNKDFEGAHNAMNDVIALRDCFFELKRIGIIKIKN